MRYCNFPSLPLTYKQPGDCDCGAGGSHEGDLFAKGKKGKNNRNNRDEVDAGADFYGADDVAGFVPGGKAEAGCYKAQEEKIYPVEGIGKTGGVCRGRKNYFCAFGVSAGYQQGNHKNYCKKENPSCGTDGIVFFPVDNRNKK